MNIILLVIFVALFTLGLIMYLTIKKDWCKYKYNGWIYDFLYNHDSEISIMGICIMVIFGTAIMIWLLFNI